MSLTTEISIKWCDEDIQQCARGWDDSLEDILTAEECSEVLDYLKYNHDATVGINWDVIDNAISAILTCNRIDEVKKSNIDEDVHSFSVTKQYMKKNKREK
tara:strand:+ start:370 stop:672 length:303 start_codon:yes stop_codon:yes gene_type:complete